MVSGLLAGWLTMIGAAGFVGAGNGLVTSLSTGLAGAALGGASTTMATGALTSGEVTVFAGTSAGSGILATTTGRIGRLRKLFQANSRFGNNIKLK